MNAQDIIEVKHTPRKDYAPEGEKRVELHVHSNMSTMDATNSISDLVAQAGNGALSYRHYRPRWCASLSGST